MNTERVAELAKKHMKSRRSHLERETGFTFYHGQRVAVGAVELRKRLSEDDRLDDILRCAGMFHDIGKGFPDHSKIGAEIAEFVLRDELSREELSEVCRLIFAHDRRAPGTEQWDFPAKIIQDADLLDHFGTMETWLNFHYYAHTDEPIGESVKFYRDQFFSDAERYGKALNFAESRRIFEEKVAFSRAFYERMTIEARGGFVL